MNKDNLRKYWDLCIIRWEKDTYGFRNRNIIERLSFILRRPLRRRFEIALYLLKPYLPYYKILELGCGSGLLCEELLKNDVKDITCVDISLTAIQRAENRINKNNFAKQNYKFLCEDALKIDYSDYNIIVGIGLLDWLEIDEIKELFDRIKDKFFVLSFSQRKWNIFSILHRFYWLLRILVFKFKIKPVYYSINQIKEMANFRKMEFLQNKDMSLSIIIYNLP